HGSGHIEKLSQTYQSGIRVAKPLRYVECLVVDKADSVPRTKAGLTIPEEIPSHTHVGTEVVQVFGVERPLNLVAGKIQRCIGKHGRTRVAAQDRLELERIALVCRCVVIPTQAAGQSKSLASPPMIFEVEGMIIEDIVAQKGRTADKSGSPA